MDAIHPSPCPGEITAQHYLVVQCHLCLNIYYELTADLPHFTSHVVAAGWHNHPACGQSSWVCPTCSQE